MKIRLNTETKICIHTYIHTYTHHTQHVYEKMISGMYLGEIVRLVAIDMISKEVLLPGQAPEVCMYV